MLKNEIRKLKAQKKSEAIKKNKPPPIPTNPTISIHPIDISKEEIILHPKYESIIKPGDIIEIYDPKNGSDEKNRLFLQVKAFQELRGVPFLSISERIAVIFEIKPRIEVYAQPIKDTAASSIEYIEICFKDQFISRSDMWKYTLAMQGKTVHISKLVRYNSIKGKVRQIVRLGQPCKSGVITKQTKFTFRSMSSNIFWLFQMSKEMFEIDKSDGEHFLEKAIHVFSKSVMKRWDNTQVNHSLTILLFTRCFVSRKNRNKTNNPISGSPQSENNEEEQENDEVLHQTPRSPNSTDSDETEAKTNFLPDGREYIDFYKVIQVYKKHDSTWKTIWIALKTEFFQFPLMVEAYGVSHGIKLQNSTSQDGNFLEALRLVLIQTENNEKYVDLLRTGNDLVLVSAGNGVFNVHDPPLASKIKKRIVDTGISVELVCLAIAPVYTIPLFVYPYSSQPQLMGSNQQNQNLTTNNNHSSFNLFTKTHNQDQYQTPRGSTASNMSESVYSVQQKQPNHNNNTFTTTTTANNKYNKFPIAITSTCLPVTSEDNNDDATIPHILPDSQNSMNSISDLPQYISQNGIRYPLTAPDWMVVMFFSQSRSEQANKSLSNSDQPTNFAPTCSIQTFPPKISHLEKGSLLKLPRTNTKLVKLLEKHNNSILSDTNNINGNQQDGIMGPLLNPVDDVPFGVLKTDINLVDNTNNRMGLISTIGESLTGDYQSQNMEVGLDGGESMGGWMNFADFSQKSDFFSLQSNPFGTSSSKKQKQSQHNDPNAFSMDSRGPQMNDENTYNSYDYNHHPPQSQKRSMFYGNKNKKSQDNLKQTDNENNNNTKNGNLKRGGKGDTKNLNVDCDEEDFSSIGSYEGRNNYNNNNNTKRNKTIHEITVERIKFQCDFFDEKVFQDSKTVNSQEEISKSGLKQGNYNDNNEGGGKISPNSLGVTKTSTSLPKSKDEAQTAVTTHYGSYTHTSSSVVIPEMNINNGNNQKPQLSSSESAQQRKLSSSLSEKPKKPNNAPAIDDPAIIASPRIMTKSDSSNTNEIPSSDLDKNNNNTVIPSNPDWDQSDYYTQAQKINPIPQKILHSYQNRETLSQILSNSLLKTPTDQGKAFSPRSGRHKPMPSLNNNSQVTKSSKLLRSATLEEIAQEMNNAKKGGPNKILSIYRKRWSHLTPNKFFSIITAKSDVNTINWLSLIEPAVLPLSSNHWVDEKEFKLLINKSHSLYAEDKKYTVNTLVKELISQRIKRGFQLCFTEGMNNAGTAHDSFQRLFKLSLSSEFHVIEINSESIVVKMFVERSQIPAGNIPNNPSATSIYNMTDNGNTVDDENYSFCLWNPLVENFQRHSFANSLFENKLVDWNKLDTVISGFFENESIVEFKTLQIHLIPDESIDFASPQSSPQQIPSSDVKNPSNEDNSSSKNGPSIFLEANSKAVHNQNQILQKRIDNFQAFLNFMKTGIPSFSSREKIEVQIQGLKQENQNEKDLTNADNYLKPKSVFLIKDMQELEKDRYEWIRIRYKPTYHPLEFFEFKIDWLVCRSTLVSEFVVNLTRSAKKLGFGLIITPSNAFSENPSFSSPQNLQASSTITSSYSSTASQQQKDISQNIFTPFVPFQISNFTLEQVLEIKKELISENMNFYPELTTPLEMCSNFLHGSGSIMIRFTQTKINFVLNDICQFHDHFAGPFWEKPTANYNEPTEAQLEVFEKFSELLSSKKK